jgi:hypothetical protein
VAAFDAGARSIRAGAAADTGSVAGSLGAAFGGVVATLRALAGAWRRRQPPHRGRVDPPEIVALVDALREQVEVHHPGVQVRGLVPARGGLLVSVDGQETVVSLTHLQRQIEAFPDAFGEIVRGLVDQIRGEALDRIEDHLFLDVFPELLPQIKSTAWLRDHGPPFGDAALAHRSLGADLVVCYVIDGPTAVLFVCQGHLRRWGRSIEDLHSLAMRNLRERVRGQVPLPRHSPILLHTGDGYDAARVLLLDPSASDGLLVAMPDKDTLWLGCDGQVDLGELLRDNERLSTKSAYPVSPRVYRIHGGRLAPIDV